MDSYLTAEILKALAAGDLGKVITYGLIFIFIWVEVRGMKKELKKINGTITESFAAGEKRFEAVEDHVLQIEHRLTVIEESNKPQGGMHERTAQI